MHAELETRLDRLHGGRESAEVLASRRGIEKESLRITPDGHLALTPHPPSLGSALTHPHITTDFSEALLEFITEPHGSIAGALHELEEIHRFVYGALGDDELLWVTSMPCLLADDRIPVARYGSSNVARMKTVYRLGLAHRYGRQMQTIAGIHYNISLTASFWDWWRGHVEDGGTRQATKTRAYFGLIRNFHRLAWLLVYLFGASPALCKTFLGGRPHALEPLTRGTLHAPWGTSLRMGDLGYQSDAQSGLDISYNCLEEYIDTLEKAVTTPHPDYERIGVRGPDGYRQLNTSLLQIENEFYSTIRPKQPTGSGEAPRRALARRGVEYVEVRCLDLNPFLPLGIDEDAARFLETFLVYCQLSSSPWSSSEGRLAARENLRRVVNRGREPGLELIRNGTDATLQDWALELLADMAPVAALLDDRDRGDASRRSLARQREKVEDPERTPSATVLRLLRERDEPFFYFAMAQARQHRDAFRAQPLDAGRQAEMQDLCVRSLHQQAELESGEDLDFDSYLARYFAQ